MKKIKLLLLTAVISIVLTGCGENLYEQGVEQLKNEQYEEAADTFLKAIEDKDELADSYRGLGIACFELGEYENARDAFLNAIEEGAKESVTLHSFLGNCELELGNNEKAISYYEEVLDSKKADAGLVQDAEFNIIVAYEQMMDLDTVNEKLAEYLEKYPDDEKAIKEKEFLETR